jgi:hypothetical protein
MSHDLLSLPPASNQMKLYDVPKDMGEAVSVLNSSERGLRSLLAKSGATQSAAAE